MLLKSLKFCFFLKSGKIYNLIEVNFCTMKKNWRDAATLIIASENHRSNSKYDYDILIFRRTQKTSFRENNICFPGGTLDETDESLKWVQYFTKHNVDLSKFKSNPKDPMIFQNNDKNKLPREISLRINAVRETFEEIGVILCRHSKQENDDLYHHSKSIDIPFWQKEIQNKNLSFLEFCEKFDLVPQIEFIHKWNCWLTPTIHDQRRFATATFFIKLNEFPPIYPEASEVQDFQWATVDEIFTQHEVKKIWIPPPVYAELYLASQFNKLCDIEKYLEVQKSYEINLNFAVQYKLLDGIMMVVIGDDFYPKNPDYYNKFNEDFLKYSEFTFNEMRKKSKNIKRFEFDVDMEYQFIVKTNNSTKL